MKSDYKSWLPLNREICQVPGCMKAAEQFCHSQKQRPYGGGTGLKPNDLGAVMECQPHHYKEHNDGFYEVWETRHVRDLIVLRNLAEYAEYLDPGIDLIADVMESALNIVEGL